MSKVVRPASGPIAHQRSRAGVALLWSAVIACPCHWPVIVLGLFGGTLAGAFLRSHFLLIVALATLYFTVAVGAGLWLLRRGKRVCAGCSRGVASHRAEVGHG